MHIGFLISEWGYHHGWANYSTSLLEALQAHDIKMTVVTSRASQTWDRITSHQALPRVSPPDNALILREARLIPTLTSLLADCDVLHTTIELYAPLGRWIAGKRPHVLTIHGSYAHWPRIQRWPSSAVYQRAYTSSQIVCVSHYTRRVVQQLMPEAQTHVVLNGINLQHTAPNDAAPVEKHGPTLLTVGGVKKRKGTLHLIRAMAKVREAIPDVQCVILGNIRAEARYRDLVQAEIERFDLQACVHMPGFVDEAIVRGWYQAADVFVLPSMNDDWKFEGFGLVHLEASAAGLPVIGTTNNGAEDAIIDNETGLLVEQARVDEELAGAILQILQNPALAKKMAAAGQHHAQTQTWARVARQMVALYERFLQG